MVPYHSSFFVRFILCALYSLCAVLRQESNDSSRSGGGSQDRLIDFLMLGFSLGVGRSRKGPICPDARIQFRPHRPLQAGRMALTERGLSGLQPDGKNVVEVKYLPPQEKDRQSHNHNGQYLAQVDFAAPRVGVPGEQGKYVERRKSKDPGNQYVVDVVRVTQVLIGMLNKKRHF